MPVDTAAPAPVAVPQVVGLSVRAAALALHRRGFQVIASGTGSIARSSPSAGTKAPFGATVHLQAE
jgi:beta-lactam-binding protein with PASTA domain